MCNYDKLYDKFKGLYLTWFSSTNDNNQTYDESDCEESKERKNDQENTSDDDSVVGLKGSEDSDNSGSDDEVTVTVSVFLNPEPRRIFIQNGSMEATISTNFG